MLAAVAAELAEAHLEMALVGGLAVSVRTEPRFTRDVDIAVATAHDSEAEALVGRFMAGGWSTEALVEQEAVGRLSTARILPPGEGDAVVDLLFASSGIEREVVEGAEALEVFPAVTVPVATVAALIVQKLLAESELRPQDTVDLAALFNVATTEDLDTARGLARLVVDRGYNRDRDLVELLEQRTR